MAEALRNPGSSSLRRQQQELVGKVLGGRYKVDRLIGHGGMSAVYAARDPKTGEEVALKVLKGAVTDHPETVDRFVQESLAVALVHHPNVVRSLGAFEDDDGAPIMVLELLHGRSLDRVIREEGPLTIGQAVRIALDAAEGIAAVHAKGIVHRDLKPANVFLPEAPDGTPEPVKVLDFGVSLLNDPLLRESAARRTGGGEMLGTPQYMAPEQVHDARAADAVPRQDVPDVDRGDPHLYAVADRGAPSGLPAGARRGDPPGALEEARGTFRDDARARGSDPPVRADRHAGAEGAASPSWSFARRGDRPGREPHPRAPIGPEHGPDQVGDDRGGRAGGGGGDRGDDALISRGRSRRAPRR
jgi:serine/threonine protein kinase